MSEQHLPDFGPEESHESVHPSTVTHASQEPTGSAQQPAAYPWIREFIELMQRNVPQAQPQPQAQEGTLDKNYEKIRRQGAYVFTGTIEPAEAEEWLRNTERVLDRFDCTEEQRVRYAVSLFEKDAYDWWETVPGSKNRPLTLTWADFLREFTDKYAPVFYCDKKKVEFLELKQNDLSVADYELQFVWLSKYAPEEVATDDLKRKRFERGLKLEIRERLVVRPPTYNALLEMALRAEETLNERATLEAKKRKITRQSTSGTSQRSDNTFLYTDSSFQRGGFRGWSMSQPGRSSSRSYSRGFGGFSGQPSPSQSQSQSQSGIGRGLNHTECVICGRRHSRECWGVNPIRCYYCNKLGHYVNECPRKQANASQTVGHSSIGNNLQTPNTSRGWERGGRSGGHSVSNQTGSVG